MGEADLVVGGERVQLQCPWRFSTHFSFPKATSWRCTVGGHEVEVVMERPRVAGGFRKKTFTVRVDGTVVAQTTAT